MIEQKICFSITLALLIYGSIIDIKRRSVSNLLILAIASIWIIFNIYICMIGRINVYSILLQVLQAAIIFAILLLLTCFIEKISKTSMLGGGDIKLLSSLSLYLGAVDFLVMMLVACVASIVFATISHLIRGGRGGKFLRSTIPFVPCITIGFVISSAGLFF